MARILVVEDSAPDAQFAQNALESMGHDVEVVSNASEGVQRALEDAPDLVLMDIVFDGMSGFQGARKIARSGQEIPLIFTSRKSQQSDREWGLRQGAKDYLVKPVTEDQLRQAVERALQESQ